MAVRAQCALRSARAAVTRAMVPTSPDSGSPHSSRSFWRRKSFIQLNPRYELSLDGPYGGVKKMGYNHPERGAYSAA